MPAPERNRTQFVLSCSAVGFLTSSSLAVFVPAYVYAVPSVTLYAGYLGFA